MAFAGLALLLACLIVGVIYGHSIAMRDRQVEAWLHAFPPTVLPHLIESDALPIKNQLRLLRETGLFSYFAVDAGNGQALTGFGEAVVGDVSAIPILDETGTVWGQYGYKVDTGAALQPLILAMVAALAAILIATMGLRYFFRRAIRRQLSGFDLFIHELEALGCLIAQERDSSGLKELRTRGAGETEEERRIATVIGNLLKAISSFHERALAAQVDVERLALYRQIGAQVAHDIRSPLAALETAISGLKHVDEAQRMLAFRAFARIKDIAHQWMRASLAKSDDMCVNTEKSLELLQAVIDEVVAEKRAEYRSRVEVEIAADMVGVMPLFAHVQAAELKRILSNLVNNGVEAIEDVGRVIVDLERRGAGEVVIRVRDDGRGIPEDVRGKLGTRGFSHGKASGNGLGVAHAMETVSRWGGRIAIEPAQNRGTVVSVVLPIAASPDWFQEAIRIPVGSVVVIVDDDPSIHAAWSMRFAPLRKSGEVGDLKHFECLADAAAWLRQNSSLDDSLFLVDYEFAGEARTGLDLITDFNLIGRTVLVTSRHDSEQLRDVCRRLGVRILPKMLESSVPLCVLPANEASSPIDAVLIDDDVFVREAWEMAAARRQVHLRTYATSNEFLADSDRVAKAVPIYLDFHLSGDEDGVQLARRLFDKGFRTLILATGTDAQHIGEAPWLTAVIGKDPPWMV